ncbi:MAG: 3-phosphoshikimate 1-carboxyvinyltransferase [Candidatus Peregrinibacteria bacterium]|nr:3-phosphoshikimate 1-carboxyvinyltransferase [Candidatus Peregrinibacteria bacterium]MDZ4244355.1 3-phosphoshikimate 1-carboxyvinyltransferase [Candidatus Gracilibacteria bacterium]
MEKLQMHPIDKNKIPKHFEIAVPGSKSYANRALLTAALACGKSVLTNMLISDDTEVMIQALKELGIKIIQKGTTITVHGGCGKFKKPNGKLYFENAGTAIRFMAAALAMQDFECIITGNPRMKNRPIKDLVNALRSGGAKIEYLGTEDYPPLLIKGGFKGGKIKVPGEISSQFVSSLLLISPYTEKLTDVMIEGVLASKPYVDMTLKVMKDFGVSQGKRNGYQRFIINNKATYHGTNYEIEADASSASYFFALAALHGTEVTVTNAKYKSAQGDIKLVNLLEKSGCQIKKGETQGITVKGPEKLDDLKSIGDINMNTMPDVALTMAIVATFSKGRTRLKNIPNLRVKESDRILAMTQELNKVNCKARQMLDGIEVKGHPHKYHGAEIETYDDHRIAMCFGILGTVVPGITILNPDCVSKTYPDFWKDLEKFNVKTELIKD